MPFYIGKGSIKRSKTICGRNTYWKNIVNKADGFKVEYFVKDVDEELAFLVEMEAIDAFRKRGITLCNLTDGGEGTKGKALSPELIERIASKNRGKKRTLEQIKKMSALKTGRKLSPETIAKMSAAKKGKPPNNMGKVYKVKKPFTEEHRAKMSMAHQGKKQSEETRLKRSLATKGRPKSEETKMRMKLAQSSPESRALQSERMKAVRANKKWSTKKLVNPPVSPSSQPLPWSA